MNKLQSLLRVWIITVMCILTQDTHKAHMVRAALEAAAYQTQDLLTCMQEDIGETIHTIRVDGGMIQNAWLRQFLADILRIEIHYPKDIETTVLGAAKVAALGCGIFSSIDELKDCWQAEKYHQAQLPQQQRDAYYAAWTRALETLVQ